MCPSLLGLLTLILCLSKLSPTFQMFSYSINLSSRGIKIITHPDWSSPSERTAQHRRNSPLIYVDLVLKPCCEADLMYYSQQQPCVRVCMFCMCALYSAAYVILTHHRHNGMLRTERQGVELNWVQQNQKVRKKRNDSLERQIWWRWKYKTQGVFNV